MKHETIIEFGRVPIIFKKEFTNMDLKAAEMLFRDQSIYAAKIADYVVTCSMKGEPTIYQFFKIKKEYEEEFNLRFLKKFIFTPVGSAKICEEERFLIPETIRNKLKMQELTSFINMDGSIQGNDKVLKAFKEETMKDFKKPPAIKENRQFIKFGNFEIPFKIVYEEDPYRAECFFERLKTTVFIGEYIFHWIDIEKENPSVSIYRIDKNQSSLDFSPVIIFHPDLSDFKFLENIGETIMELHSCASTISNHLHGDINKYGVLSENTCYELRVFYERMFPKTI